MNLYTMMSVLFADLSHINLPIDTLRKRFANAIDSYGGMLDSTTTEHLILAYFIDEQHPEQAARAGLTVQAELLALSVENQLLHRPILTVGVILLSLDDLTDTPLKFVQANTLRLDEADVIATCQDIGQLWPDGGVLVNHEVYKFIRGIFDIDAVDEQATDGLISADWYWIKRARPRIFSQPIHTIAGIETIMVDRSTELAVISNVLDTIHTQRRLHVISVLGDSGIGKSRLLDEFQNYLELRKETVWLFRARLEPTSKHLPYGLIRSLLAFRFQIHNSDTIAMARQALVEGVQRFIPGSKGEATAHFIGHLIGMNFLYSNHIRAFADRGQPIEYRAMQAIEDFLRAVAADDPIVMMIEGLHWADNASLTLLSYIFQSCQDIPLLLFMTAQPEFITENPTWYPSDRHHPLHLMPLNEAASYALLSDILSQKNELNLAPVVQETIVERAIGNPLLMEALIIDAIDLCQDNDTQALLDNLSLDLGTAVMRRIEYLPTLAQLVLEKASCIGQTFWGDAVMTILEEIPREDVKQALELLQEQDFIYETRPSSFPITPEYRFRHNTLYGLVLGRAAFTPQDHSRIANWRIAHSAQRVNEYAGILGQRYELAQKPTQAIEYYLRAGKQSESVGAIAEAVWFYKQALRLHQQGEISDSKRAALLFALGRLQWDQGDFETADITLSASYELAKTIGDQLLQAKAVYMMGKVAYKISSSSLARHLLEESIALGRQIGDRPIVADGLHALGELALDEGDFEAAQLFFNDSLSTHQTARQESHLGRLMINLSRLSLGQGDYQKALSFGRTALQIGERNHAIKVMLDALVNLAPALAACSRPEHARLAALAVLQHPISPALSRRQAKAVLEQLESSENEHVQFAAVVKLLVTD